jgi:hypothetical protein
MKTVRFGRFQVRMLHVLIIAALLWIATASPENGRAGPQQPEGALTSAFTYQGQLKQGGSPVTATCDLQFGLYDTLTLGVQQGITQTLSAQSVTNGLFSVQLNGAGQFGANAFNGQQRWLAVSVRCPAGSGAYNALSPRQELSAAPYALYSLKSGSTAALQGQPVSTGAPSSGQALKYNGSQWAPAADLNGDYQNYIVVAKSGGDFTSISAALASITTASTSNRFLIKVMPGVYTEQVTMKGYVDIEGAGELNTKITWTGFTTDSGTLVGANNAELRLLTVENTGGSSNSFAIYNYNSAPRLTHVTAIASGSGAYNIGVYNHNGANPAMDDVTASASGGANNYGVFNRVSSPVMTNVNASASGGTNSTGVHNYISAPQMTAVTASGTGATGSTYGVYNEDSAPVMTEVTASAFSGANSYGVYNTSSSPSMTGVNASASSATTKNYGVYNGAASSPVMTNVTASATLGDESYGVYNTASSPSMNGVTASASFGHLINYGVNNLAGSNPQMTNVTASALGGSLFTTGVYNDHSSPVMIGVIASASQGDYENHGIRSFYGAPIMENVSASASGGQYAYGIRTEQASPVMTNVFAGASGATIASYAVYNWNCTAVMNNVTAKAWGTSSNYAVLNAAATLTIQNSALSAFNGSKNYGIYNQSSTTINVDNSQVTGSTNTIVTFGGPVKIGASLLSGGPIADTGTVCAGVYDEAYVFYPSTCP